MARPRTTVVNLTTSEYDVYIGRERRNNGKAKSDHSGMFGNPFRIEGPGAAERERVIGLYRNYFYARVKSDKEFMRAVKALQGKRLGCFCSPQPCHGDVIVEYLEGKHAKDNGSHAG